MRKLPDKLDKKQYQWNDHDSRCIDLTVMCQPILSKGSIRPDQGRQCAWKSSYQYRNGRLLFYWGIDKGIQNNGKHRKQTSNKVECNQCICTDYPHKQTEHQGLTCSHPTRGEWPIGSPFH